MSTLRSRRAFTMVEFLIALTLSLVVVAAIMQTVRLNWQSLSKANKRAGLLADSKRLLGQLSKTLRNSGYNPLATTYDLGNNLEERIGIIAAYPDRITFTSDTMSKEEAIPDGKILAASTLDEQLNPVAGATDAREVKSIRFVDGRLESFRAFNDTSRWQLLAESVSRFRIDYFDAAGNRLGGRGWHLDPNKLKEIRRLDISLELYTGAAQTRVSSLSSTSVELRNPPRLTP